MKAKDKLTMLWLATQESSSQMLPYWILLSQKDEKQNTSENENDSKVAFQFILEQYKQLEFNSKKVEKDSIFLKKELDRKNIESAHLNEIIEIHENEKKIKNNLLRKARQDLKIANSIIEQLNRDFAAGEIRHLESLDRFINEEVPEDWISSESKIKIRKFIALQIKKWKVNNQ